MKNIKFLLGLLFIAAMLLTSCGKDVDEFTPGDNNPDPTYSLELGADITTDVAGIVLDELGNPMEGAVVTGPGRSTTTDENGVFILRDMGAKERLAYVKVRKSGYFLGSRTIVPNADGDLDQVEIKMIPKQIVATINALDGGEVEFQDVKLTLPANGYVDGNGNQYTGSVAVAAFFIDPTASDLQSIMPGDLRAVTAQNQEVALTTFGMFAIELTADDGTELNLDGVAEAIIDSPVPASILASAPATIPMWHFNEDNGLWEEEGEATLQGDRYVGTVKHFSFWNHDFQGPLVDVKGRILDQDGNPISGMQVRIDMVNAPNRKGWGRTNDIGVFCGIIPANEELEINVIDNCGNVIYTSSIGPFADNVDLGDLTVNVTGPSSVLVTGTLVDCDSMAVTNGYVIISGGNNRGVIYVDTDGTFSYNLVGCEVIDSVSVQGWDVSNLKQSNAAQYLVSNGTVDVFLEACDQLDNFLTYTLGTDTYTYVDGSFFQDSIFNPNGGLGGSSINAFDRTQGAGGGYISMVWADYGNIGTFTADNAFIEGNPTFGFASLENGGTINVTYFGGLGDFIEGTFDLPLEDDQNPGTVYQITGAFRLEVQ